MVTIKKSTNNNCWRGCGEKGTLLHSWWDCKSVQPLWKAVRRVLRKLNLELPFDPAIPLLGIYPEKTTTRKDTCTPMFIAALFAIAKTWKQPKCLSTDEWIKKSVTYIQWNTLRSLKHGPKDVSTKQKQKMGHGMHYVCQMGKVRDKG